MELFNSRKKRAADEIRGSQDDVAAPSADSGIAAVLGSRTSRVDAEASQGAEAPDRERSGLVYPRSPVPC